MFAAGSIVHFLDLNTMTTSYLPSVGGNEVGCIEVQVERKLIAICEKGNMPNVFIYEYPSLNLKRVLRNGTERAYSAVNFSGDGEKLATVGSFPDYMITVWDWNKENIILRTKAFSQEVYRVSFSPRFEGQLVTSGMAHIRFWKMAQTFTGLKLQGDIGKFGQVELSDISGYCELPDGKILSGSDWGNLLLWEGNLIKCEITHGSVLPAPSGKPSGLKCHAGAIDVVMLDGAQIITGGADGYLRTWNLAEIEQAEVTDELPKFLIKPTKEVKLLGVEEGRTKSRIVTMLKGSDHWLVQDAEGSVYKVVLETGAAQTLFSFHSGGIAALDVSPFNHCCATAGSDGSVRLWDYVEKSVTCLHRSPAAATCISWASRAVDPEGRTLATAYADGVVRILARCKDGLQLRTAFKPHGVAIGAMAYSPDGAHLATGAADGSVFFITVARGEYSPVGFVPPSLEEGQSASAVTALVWSADDSLLVGYADGTCAELALPTDVDTTESYELPFEGRVFDMTPIIEYRRMVAKIERDKNKPAPPPAPDEPEPVDPLAPEPEPEPEEEIPDLDAGGVLALLPAKNTGVDKAFTVSFEKEGGTMWKVQWGSDKVQPVSRNASAVCFLGTSRSGAYVVSGGTDGSVCVAEAEGDSYWLGATHGASDNVSAQLSFDDAYLLSAGMDGNLFVHKMATADAKDDILSAMTLPTLNEAGAGGVDITDPATYSIEEAKQKMESDARAAAAESKKLTVRERVENLRKKFSALLDENTKLPAVERLPREAFYVDPGLQEWISKETAARLAEKRLEMAYDSEKILLSLNKLKSNFLDGLAVEHVALHGFASGLAVRSFRTTEVPPWLREATDHVHALIDKEQKSRQRGAAAARGGEGFGAGEGDEAEGGEAQNEEGEAGKENEKLSKMQQRLLRRQARAKEWAEFNSKKPDDKYEDPVDVAAIQYAEAHMGDFSLKTDSDYVVPEAQRVTAQKKRRQIVLLDESIHALRMAFNERFLAMRDLKKRLIVTMAEEDARLAQINRQLAVFDPLTPDLLSPGGLVADEQPELRTQTTEEQLNAFAQEKAEAAAKAKAGGMGGGMAAKKPDAASGAAAASDAATAAEIAEIQKLAAKLEAAQASMSDMEKAELQLVRERLLVEKDQLVQRRKRTIASFDDALGELRTEKLRLEADLKTTDLRKLVLFQELAHLKEFEKKDTTLAKRLESKHTEKAEIVQRVAECQEKLATKKTEIERLLDRDRQIMAEFNAALGDNNKFYDVLLKIFKRKIKRKKQSDGDGDDDDYDEDEEDSDDDDDFDEDEEEEEETCPAGCDPALYDKVCELREKRLEQEEVYAEFQKGVEALKKENDMLIKKEKIIDNALKATENDIQAFQNEKQAALNEISVMVTLNMSQVRHIEPDAKRLPSDLTQDLVFASDEMFKLQKRIKELGEEKAALRKRQKTLRQEHVALHREQSAKAERISELDARVRDVQLLKFGQVIDLERIESVGVNKAGEELKVRITKVEATQEQALQSWLGKLKSTKQSLKDATDQSTGALNKVASLFERQHALETSLNAKQGGAAPKEPGTERKERTSLVQLVKIQAKEVEALKLEINMLRRKGGHVYTGK